MAYRIEFTGAARRDLRAVPPAILAHVDVQILSLADTPRPRGVERIRGSRGGLRVRVGAYRILYVVDDVQQVVTIARIRHRRDVYREL